MNRWIGGLTIAVVVMCLMQGETRAQDNRGNIPGVPDRLKFTLGGFLTNASPRDDGTTSGWGLMSGSYELTRPSPTRLLDLAVYFEGATGQESVRINDFRYRSYVRDFVGVGLSTTMRLTPPAKSFGLYALAGGGIYSVERRASAVTQYLGFPAPLDADPDTGTVTRTISSRRGYRLGYKVGGGIRFGRGLFVEGAYFNLGKLEDTGYSGVGLAFGVRL